MPICKIPRVGGGERGNLRGGGWECRKDVENESQGRKVEAEAKQPKQLRKPF